MRSTIIRGSRLTLETALISDGVMKNLTSLAKHLFCRPKRGFLLGCEGQSELRQGVR